MYNMIFFNVQIREVVKVSWTFRRIFFIIFLQLPPLSVERGWAGSDWQWLRNKW